MPIEQDELEQRVQEQVRKVLAESHPELVKTEPEPLTLNINGAQYKFKDQADLEAALGTTFTTFNSTLKERDQKLQEAEKVSGKEGSYVSGKENESTFKSDEYIRLMGEDILKANDYMLNHQLFGGKVPNASQALREKFGEIEKSNATIAVYQFKELHPEFPLTEQATKTIDGLRRELGQPFSLQGLQAAYGVAQARGLLPSPAVAAYHAQLVKDGKLKEESTQDGQGSGQPNLGFAPPPSVSRSAPAPSPDFVSQAEKMSLEELSRVLRGAGML